MHRAITFEEIRAVQPAAREEKRYTLQEAFQAFEEMGYELTRSNHLLPLRPTAQGIIARLKTRCGCTRHMPLRSLVPTIRVPVYAAPVVSFDRQESLNDTFVTIREFEYVRSNDGIFEYVERA